TVDGSRYLDWVMSWGPLLFGHADPETVAAVVRAAEEGTTFGAPTEAEVELAAEIVDAVPSVERVRLVSSGTEAAMSAIRLARGARRAAGALRRPSGPDRPRQDRGRRAAARGLRRPGGPNGSARACRGRVPGGHALGQPARDRRRALRAAPAPRRRRLRGAR